MSQSLCGLDVVALGTSVAVSAMFDRGPPSAETEWRDRWGTLQTWDNIETAGR